MSEWKDTDVLTIMANPLHCLGNEPLVSEKLWIEAATRRIKEDGDNGAMFLRDLLEHLKSSVSSS